MNFVVTCQSSLRDLIWQCYDEIHCQQHEGRMKIWHQFVKFLDLKRQQIQVNYILRQHFLNVWDLHNFCVSTHHSMVIFLVLLKASPAFLIHDVIFFHPPPALSVSLRDDVCYEFHFRYEVYLEPLVTGISVWSPTSVWIVKSSPSHLTIAVCRRCCDLIVCYWAVLHSQRLGTNAV